MVYEKIEGKNISICCHHLSIKLLICMSQAPCLWWTQEKKNHFLASSRKEEREEYEKKGEE